MTTTTTRLTPTDARPVPGAEHLPALAAALVADGPAAHDTALCALALAAREAGVPAAVVDALADDTAPDVVRLRAFAVAARTLS